MDAAVTSNVRPPAVQNASTASGVTRVTHQVKRGETLFSIAKLYRTTVAALQQSNRISGNAIKAGQRLTILRTDGVATH